MTDAWRWSAVTGILLGAGAFVVLFVPILVWQSVRFGRMRGARTLAAGAAAVYGVTILAYTLLPLPEDGWCAAFGGRGQLYRPLRSIDEIADAVQGLSVREALRSFTVLQVALNVVLFVPWGAFVRRLFGRKVLTAGLSGAVLSLLIETSQGTGLWGFYDCAYRVADVDDLITNTLGAFVGAIAAPALLWWLPTTDADVARRDEPHPVTRGRRLAGMAVDGFTFFGVWGAASLAVIVVERYDVARPITTHGGWAEQTVPGAAAWFLVVLVPSLIGSGASLGQRAMWLRPDPGTAWRLRGLVRVLTGFGGYALLQVLATVPGTPHWLRWAAGALAWVLVAGALLALVLDRRARGLSYAAARTSLVDSREAG